MHDKLSDFRPMSHPSFILPDPSGQETLESFADASYFNRWMFEAIAPFCRGKVIEIGSGIGNMSKLLLNQSLQVTLSDIRPEYCRILQQEFGKHPRLGGIHQLDLAIPNFVDIYPPLLGQFDTVVALNVIEHIGPDGLAVLNARELLRPGGRLIVLVPAFQWLNNSLDKELGHFRRYTKNSLAALLTGAGLRVARMRYFNAAGIPAWWYSGSVRHNRIIHRHQVALYNKLVPVFRLIDKLVLHQAGLSVVAVAVNA